MSLFNMDPATIATALGNKSAPVTQAVESPAPEPVEDAAPAEEAATQDEAANDEVSASDDNASEDESTDDSILRVKAFGSEHEVDLKDKDKVSKLLSKGLAAPKLFSENAKLKQEVKQLKETANPDRLKKADLFDKLEQTFKLQGEDAVYAMITGGKSVEERINAEVERRLKLMDASPDERIRMEREYEQQRARAERERYENQVKHEREERERLKNEYASDRAYNLAYPEFQRVFSQLDLSDKDPVHAQSVAENIWDQTWSRIERKYGEGTELSAEQLRKEFTSTAKLYNYTIKQKVKKEVAKAVEKKREVATKQAAAYASRNYSKSDLDSKFQGRSPTEIHKLLFGE